MQTVLSPSMMCADIGQLVETLRVFQAEKVEYLHIDVMDGVFVPNYALGIDYIHRLRKLTDIPLDIHLMVEEPEKKIEWLDIQKGELISVHVEACRHLQRTLGIIHQMGGQAFAALVPATPPSVLEYVLDDIDGVLIMTVNPGFAGQKALPATIQKISDTRHFLDAHGKTQIRIEVDGNVSYALAPQMAKRGADILVAGSSSFLNENQDLSVGIQKMRNLVKTANAERQTCRLPE